MVMMTRSAYRKAGESFDESSDKFNNAPPWCSSGKTNDRATEKPRKISLAAYETRCPYFSTGKYFTEDRNKSLHNTRKRKKDIRYKQYGIARTIVVLFFILLFGIVLLVIVSRTFDNDKYQIFSLENPSESTSLDEECCYKMKQLTAALFRAELELRRSRRQRLLISSHKEKSELIPLDSFLTEGAVVKVGSNTREWSAQVTLWGIVPLWKTTPSPDIIISPRTPTPADCWPFGGSRGEINIHFQEAVTVSCISLEHIRPDAARSAPRKFNVYGILENGTWIKALQHEYSYSRPAKQMFPINFKLPPVRTLAFRVLSNHGNRKYTCVYRLHVYGNRK